MKPLAEIVARPIGSRVSTQLKRLDAAARFFFSAGSRPCLLLWALAPPPFALLFITFPPLTAHLHPLLLRRAADVVSRLHLSRVVINLVEVGYWLSRGERRRPFRLFGLLPPSHLLRFQPREILPSAAA